MNKQDEIPLSPLAGWDIRHISAYQSIIFQPRILATAFDSIDDARPTHNYVLTEKQYRELSQTFLRAANAIASSYVEVPHNLKN